MTCTECERLLQRGRNSTDPIHCRQCHQTWTGNEAQHCVKCHQTFVGIRAADEHRYHKQANGTLQDQCWNVSSRAPWRESRPGVWTNEPQMTEAQKDAFSARRRQ